MSFQIIYWHWVILGIGLMLLEIALPSFTALWIGAAAVIVGVLVYLFPDMSATLQVALWTILSASLTWLWFRYLKPLSIDKTKAGLSREAILGEVGQVMILPNGERRGTLRFPAPVLGSDEWQFISQDSLAVGDRVRVTDVSGNSLIVSKS
ncbi:MAG: NfeD family protein [Candidatus Sedimenticola sp. (ex Thyasira tokunagai)]